MFDIREFIETDAKDRALCPACLLVKGNSYKSKNLWVEPSGNGYKCHRGCSTDEIRDALGERRDRIIPTALATPPPKATQLTPRQVEQSHDKLLTSNNCLTWLLDRGIPLEAVKHYKLGAARSKVGKGHIPVIAIPIATTDDRTHYYQKKRNAPWLPESERPAEYKPWSQYGIPAMVYFTHSPAGATETILCEGEWDAIRLGWEFRHTDEVAIACFTCGAGNVPERQELDRLPGKVTIFYDLDEPGAKGAAKLQSKLKERSAIATVPHAGEVDAGWDISNALDAGFTIGDISDAMANATAWSEPKKPNALRDRLLTNDELMASAQDFVEWLVPDILTPDELFILGMPPRGGKSLFCLTLAKAVATGGHFLDRPVTQGAVIYVNLEDNPTKIKQRQLAQSWGENLPVYWLDKFKLSELDSLKELADELPDLRLVVLDTFSRVRDDNQKESSAELGKTLEPLQEWAKERGICVLITHHTGKVSNDAPNADPFDMLRGSTSIRATCRGAIVIVPGDSSYRLLAENGFSDRLDVSVRINSDTLEWKLLGNWTPRIDGDMKTQIIDHLNLTGDATVAEIAADLNFNAGSVSTIMSRLYRDDLVSKVAGKGGKPAIYKRLSNSLKQLEAQFEASNADTASDTGSLKQDTLSKEPDGKVINGAKSDQIIDHFSKKPPTHPQLFERSHSQDGAGDTLSNSDFPSLRESNGSHVENLPPALDAGLPEEGDFIYWSEVSTLVQVLKIGAKTARVRVPGERNPRLAQIADLGEK
jgi:DNA-binding MarR family transcriptional regulator